MTDTELTAARLEQIKSAVDRVPFAQFLGIEVDEVDNGFAVLGLHIRHELTQINGVVHGGVIASLIDTATAFAIIPLLEPKEKVTTVDLTISYLRPLIAGRITATAKVVRAGRRLFVVSAEVHDPEGNYSTYNLH